MPEFLQSLLTWFAQHPTWAGIGVFLVAGTESLAIVGLFMPGVFLMFGIGALVALDALALWPTLAWATAGAAAGDIVSFWLGRHYHQRLRVMWPFRRYPGLIDRGVAFFNRHGGKSIAVGRFIGPVRPVLPLVAGMLGMAPARFLLVDIPSAAVWAPTFILPGVAFGASLQLAAEVATRLAVLLVLLVAIPWLMYWVVRWIYGALAPRAARGLDAVTRWSREHPVMGRLTAGLVDPQEPESRALVLSALLLLFGAWGFFQLLIIVTRHHVPLPLDHTVYHFFQGLRTPWGDRIMVLVTELGGQPVDLGLTLAVGLWLGLRRRWLAAGHWLAAVGFGTLATFALKAALEIPRPVPGLYTGLSTYAFPSAHATMSTVTYGFLAVLLARELPAARRWGPYTAAALIVSLVVLSRVYLGAHWLTDVLAGVSLGLVWVAVLGIAYRRHSVTPLPVGGVLGAAAAGLLLAGGWQVAYRYTDDLARYAPHHPVTTLAASGWWRDDWRRLPARRIDLAGRPSEPLNVQWAGPLPGIERALQAAGWHRPPALTAGTALRWLSSRPVLANLPLLPQVHAGRHGVLVMVRPAPGAQSHRQIALRLWNADVRLEPGAVPIWVGTVSEQDLYRPLGLIALPSAGGDFAAALHVLEGPLHGVQWRVVRRTPGHGRDDGDPDRHWDGTTVLLRTAPAAGAAAR